MTLRQVIDIVWKRRALSAITATLVVLGTAMYVLFAPATYTASTQIRFSAAVSSTASGAPTYGSIPLDLDAEYVTSPDILKLAAAALPGDSVNALRDSITASEAEELPSNKLLVAASGSSPKQATDRANAVAQAYLSHLAGQVNAGLAGLRTQLGTQQQAETAALAALAKDASDPMAQQRFTQANTQVNALQTQIMSVQSAGKPASVLRAAPPGTRSGLSPLTIMLLGVIGGIGIGSAAALVRDVFDGRLRSEADVEKILGKPVIAAVAQVPRKEFASHRLPALTTEPTSFSESVRSLRTSLQFLFPDRHSVLAITSSEPGEGKSFLSANLAVAFAQAGRSVILVEGDLRRPRLGTSFDIPTGARGLSEAVQDAASSQTIAATLVDTGIAGLQVLPAGRSTQEPSDLLASDALGPVVGRLRALADVVLFDTPPALALADAALIGGECDGVLVVASIGRTRGASLTQTLQLLRANRTHVIGAVANRSRRATVGSYAGYYLSSAQRVLATEPSRTPEPEVVPVPDDVDPGAKGAPGAEAAPAAQVAPAAEAAPALEVAPVQEDVDHAPETAPAAQAAPAADEEDAPAVAAVPDDVPPDVPSSPGDEPAPPEIDAVLTEPAEEHAPLLGETPPGLFGDRRETTDAHEPPPMSDDTVVRIPKVAIAAALAAQPAPARKPGPRTSGTTPKGSPRSGRPRSGASVTGVAAKNSAARGPADKGSGPRPGGSSEAGTDRTIASEGMPTFLAESKPSTPDAAVNDLDRHVLGSSPTERPASRRRRR